MRLILSGFYVVTALAAALAVGSYVGAEAAGPVSPAELQAQVAALIHRLEKVPGTGVSVAVVEDGQVLLTAGYGLKDREAGLLVTPRTRMGIGSTTKTFTAMALAMAADRGWIDWNTAIQEYWPQFRMKDPHVSIDLTLTDAMSHRSGLPRHDLLWILSQMPARELLGRLRFLDPNSNSGMGFREGFQYNNYMFALAGRVLELRANTSWADFVRHEILAPIGMTQTGVTIAELAGSPERAVPYYGTTRLEYLSLDDVAPAGSISSNAEDMAKWLRFQLRDGHLPDGRALVSARALGYLRTPQTFVGGTDAARTDYGIGLFMTRTPDHVTYYHPGNVPGFSTQMLFIPAWHLGVSVTVNQDGAALPYEVAEGIVALLTQSAAAPALGLFPRGSRATGLTREQEAWIARTVRMPAPSLRALPPRHGLLPPAAVNLAAYVGAYIDPGYGSLTVMMAPGGQGLVARYFRNDFSLKAVSGTDFIMTLRFWGQDIEVPIQFRLEQGRAVEVKVPFESEAPAVGFRLVVT